MANFETVIGATPRDGELITKMLTLLRIAQPSVVGMVSAFVSAEGARLYDSLARGRQSRVVAGLSGCVTNPQALRYLRDRGHDIRLGTSSAALFHPKLLVGGRSFHSSGTVKDPACGYLGSANFTRSGLGANVEVFLTTRDSDLLTQVSDVYHYFWHGAMPLTDRRLAAYELAFARAQAKRSSDDIAMFDGDARAAGSQRRTGPAFSPALCNAVWVGLESFTGEHTFQVEFPRAAGDALRSLVPDQARDVDLECSDGVIRTAIFGYYRSNGMYRLNLPNSVPLVEWARIARAGVLLVRRNEERHSAPLIAEIIRGPMRRECEEKSRLLGTLGSTTTRSYGWY